MSDSSALPKSCPKCGVALPSEATEGLCPKCLMAEAMLPTAGSKPTGPWVPPTAAELHQLLPQYEIELLLGRGGMGAVYKGKQINLDRPVAIKILSNTLDEADASFAERFKNEARAMAKLTHPGIVAVYDFGQTATGLLYIVMEFVEGTNVSRMIAKQKRLHTEHAMAITAHVCDALAYAHERGIIHRDIKPANIMVGYDGVVKVADFGLAKMNKSGESGLTQSGMAMGTLHFMAPEALMLGTAVDHRADIYAVGVMLYQMLTGKLPQGMFELPSLQVSGLDPRYDSIIARALRDDRELRYQSATEMRYDLDHILTQPVVKVEAEAAQAPAALPTGARPQRTAAQPYRPPQVYAPPPKPKSAMGGTLAWLTVIAVLLGGGYYWMKSQQPTPAAPTVATTPAPEPAKTVATTTPPASSKPSTPAEPKMPTPVMPAPSVPVPAPAPLSPELTAIDAQLSKLEQSFQAAVERDAGSAFKASLATLNAGYVRALDAAIVTATKTALLDDVLLLKAEQTALNKLPADQFPPPDDAQTPAALKTLRTTYRNALTTYTSAYAKALVPLYAKYEQNLTAMQAEETRASRIEAAQRVKAKLEVMQHWHSTTLAQAVAQPGSFSQALLAIGPNKAIQPGEPFTNTLGMKFVSVPGSKVHMCIHETRKRDYVAYATANAGVDGTWKIISSGSTPVSPGDDHPVAGVSWDDANAFCAWLSKQEGHTYRLPTEFEWNLVVVRDLGDRTNITSEALYKLIGQQYPWGNKWNGNWNPPEDAGKYRDNAKQFPATAPVMSFTPNALGIFDLGGNICEWCQDQLDKDLRVLRGGAWDNFGPYLKSSTREFSPTTNRGDYKDRIAGFRCVVEDEDAAPAVTASMTTPAVSQAAPSAASSNVQATKDKPFTNTLGMKFVPVPGTKVLMCIHETRYKDYAAYAAVNSGMDGRWKVQTADDFKPEDRPEDHPVMHVSCEDGQKFCAWLSQMEGKTYRLPTDEEWSYAVGIGHMEKRTKDTTLKMLHQALPNVYPWGNQWPPPKGSGNYSDESRKARAPSSNTQYIDGYDDGFPTTAPVMSFKPNKLGLYELEGNVMEWVGDWYDNTPESPGTSGRHLARLSHQCCSAIVLSWWWRAR